MYTVLLVIHTLIVLFLIFVILLQRSDSDGMGSLGGGGGNQFMTSRGSANFMTRTTSILAAVFMFTSIALAVYAGRTTKTSIIDSVAVEATVGNEKAVDGGDGSGAIPKDVSNKEQPAPSAPKPE